MPLTSKMSSVASRGFLAATRRQVSSAREKIRHCEPHSYDRSSTTGAHTPAWGKLIKNVTTRVIL